MDLREAKEITRSLRNIGFSYTEFGDILKEMTRDLSSLKRLIGKADKKTSDSRLIKTGVALMMLPEPFTTPIGVSLLLMGLIKNARRPATIIDVYREFQRLNREMRRVKMTINDL